MKTKLFILILLLLSGCDRKDEVLPEKTFVVTHSAGVDTLIARDSYATEKAVTFYSDKLYGQKAGLFFAPYYFKSIK